MMRYATITLSIGDALYTTYFRENLTDSRLSLLHPDRDKVIADQVLHE